MDKINFDKFKNYEEIFNASINHKKEFWGEYSNNIKWFTKPKTILSDENTMYPRWFKDGITNITYNCLDIHIKDKADKPAIIYESPITQSQEIITFKQLLDRVEKFSYVLKNKFNIKKNDRIIIYMPMIPETCVAMLSCARIGAIHSVVFGGFAANELSGRISHSEAKLIISASCGIEPHKKVLYKPLIKEALKINKNDVNVIYVNRKEHLIDIEKNEFDFYEIQKDLKDNEREKSEKLLSNDPLYILYTSGTTGKPKGVVRDHGSAVGIKFSLEFGFGFDSNSVMFATSDLGWVVGHSYILYGPLLFGASTILFEGKPIGTPDAGIFWKLIEKHKVTHLYTSPTASRTLRKEDPKGEFPKKYNLNTLKLIGVVGERTDIHTYDYLKSIVPENCVYNDTYWQTETGWFISANMMKPETFKTKGGSCTKCFPGYEIKIMDDNKQEIGKNILGKVIIKMPLPPSFMLTCWENNELYENNYLKEYPGYYLTGDAGYFDDDNYLHITTRIDDIIQVAGHRLSTAQMEECLLNNPKLAEALVIGVQDPIKGNVPFGFIVIKKGEEYVELDLIKELQLEIRKKIGPIACFKNCLIVDKLPKTRSGKILRGIVRKIVDKEKYNFPATIEDSNVLDVFHKRINNLKEINLCENLFKDEVKESDIKTELF